jgi:hypothetical protein
MARTFVLTVELRECRQPGRDGHVERWLQQKIEWSDGTTEWRNLPYVTVPLEEPQ